MRILITGTGGFVAFRMIEELAERSHVVYGTSLHAFSHADLQGGEGLLADLTDEAQVRNLLKEVRPEAIIHLAAQSNPNLSWETAGETFTANSSATAHLVRVAGEELADPMVLVVSSSDVYGRPHPSELPLTEDSPIRPQNPYAVSKIAAEQVAMLYGDRLGVRVVIARPFSHTGPFQRADFVVPSFARQVALVEAGLQEELLHGNLDSHRDFTDVRDVVRAYRMIVESKLSGGLFNICSGRSVTMQYILQYLCSLSQRPVPTRFDHTRFRPERGDELRGEALRLRRDIGWEPLIPLEQTMADVLQWQRADLPVMAQPRP